MTICFGNLTLGNHLAAASSPLTESLPRLRCCRDAGFGAAILKSAAPYLRDGQGYGRRVVYAGDGYYAGASFQREILTLEEGVDLFRQGRALAGDMALIPSVCAGSLDPAEWYDACRAFQEAGARLLQLDFFYLGGLTRDGAFYRAWEALLRFLRERLDCALMPKLNQGLDPQESCALLVRCGVEQVSLLDSLREDLPGLHPGTTSYFGPRQLPVTQAYLAAAVEAGLQVCAGGGVSTPADAARLLDQGARLVQTASYVLRRGFPAAGELLGKTPSRAGGLDHGTWCDVEDGAPCEGCGACRGRVPGNRL